MRPGDHAGALGRRSDPHRHRPGDDDAAELARWPLTIARVGQGAQRPETVGVTLSDAEEKVEARFDEGDVGLADAHVELHAPDRAREPAAARPSRHDRGVLGPPDALEQARVVGVDRDPAIVPLPPGLGE